MSSVRDTQLGCTSTRRGGTWWTTLVALGGLGRALLLDGCLILLCLGVEWRSALVIAGSSCLTAAAVCLHLSLLAHPWWPRMRANIQQSWRIIGLGSPGLDRPWRSRRQRLVCWLLLIPVAVAAVLGLYAWGLDSVLPAPSGGEITANLQRTQQIYRGGVAGLLLTLFVAAGVGEELWYRSWVLAANRLLLCHSTMLRWVIVVPLFALSTTWFAFNHLSYGAGNVASAAVGGVVYGLVALRARSLWPAILAHGLYDCLATVLP